jgi:hypothetical protein
MKGLDTKRSFFAHEDEKNILLSFFPACQPPVRPVKKYGMFSNGQGLPVEVALPGVGEAAEGRLHSYRRGGWLARALWASLGGSSRRDGR